VSVRINNPTCIKNESFYIKATILRKSGNCNIGVCAKFAYGSVDAKQLIEWFEVNRLLGVDKVCELTHTLFYSNPYLKDKYSVLLLTWLAVRM
jgi:hypothetical protein